MASSSSPPIDSPPPTSWKYDVFLSFRGTDTRYTFLDHLYKALVDQGIRSFKDDEELPRGETIRTSLLDAIEESHIAVIIFSENYAGSSWCLQELEHIMKCKVERHQIVIPIFYHVDPSEVRKHEKKYGEALAKHKSEKKDVKPWKKALEDAGNLAGLVPNGPETIFIKDIVKVIFEKLCATIPSDNEDLIGMEDRVQDLKSKLAMDSEGVVMVGIWGLGGGGKTTLARALYDQISGMFDGCCFVNNVRVKSHERGLKELQKEIISCVLKQREGEVDGDVTMLIKSRLRHKKVLLVLDDVDDANQLEALAGSHDWFSEGSRIIITTRDQHLLNIHQVNVIHDISLLNPDDAMKLFRKHTRNHIEDYDSLSYEVVSYACGLPLALKVLGSYLCDKNRREWVSAMARLKDIPNDRILEKLKISYDGLKPPLQQLFLDIACFFRRVEKDEATEILEACGFYPDIGVKELIQKALITVTKEGRFDMHDLIQEMGQYIVRGKYPQNPEKHSRVWQHEDVVTLCALPTKRNHWIEALEVSALWMGNVPQSLPHVVANMKKLRWISWYDYPATSLPINFQSTKLVYLQLEGSRLEQFWEGYKCLLNLKVLDLSRSYNLIRTPDFDGLPCLERIRLNHCQKLTCIHPSISHHERLISVDMHFCTQLKEFPPISGMKKLETLILYGCSQLCKFPEIQMNMDNMVELSLGGTGIKSIPSSIGQYCTNLLSLDLTDFINLESIEGNFHLLKYLKKFYISGFGDQELKIPAEGLFDVKGCLEVLYINNISFKTLHPGIVSMKLFRFPPSLRRLCLRFCKWINGDILSAICELSNLQVLDLQNSYFSLSHCNLSQLCSLKFLNISSCYNIGEVPDLPSSIAILKANGLTIADLSRNLRWLWRITLPMESISGCFERVKQVLYMVQGKDYSISIAFEISRMPPPRVFARRRLMLELPRNWYNEFSGFLICLIVDGIFDKKDVISIKDVMGRENEDDGTPSETWYTMCYIYISFGSLMETSWWKSRHTTISFSVQRHTCLHVELVPRSKGSSSIERVKDKAKSLEFWDTEPTEIILDSKTCIEILWTHEDDDAVSSLFDNIEDKSSLM